MPMTITEKILAAHIEKDTVSPGEFIEARVDIALGNDVTAPIAIREFEAFGAKKVFNRDRLILVPDHYAPNKDIKSAEQCKIMRNFAHKHKIKLSSQWRYDLNTKSISVVNFLSMIFLTFFLIF